MPGRREALWTPRLKSFRGARPRGCFLLLLFSLRIRCGLLLQSLNRFHRFHASRVVNHFTLLVCQCPVFIEDGHGREGVHPLLELLEGLVVILDPLHQFYPHALKVLLHLADRHPSRTHCASPERILLLLNDHLVHILDGVWVVRRINFGAVVLELPTIAEPIFHALGMEFLRRRDRPQGILLEDVVVLAAPLRNAWHCAAVGHLHRRCGAGVVMVGRRAQLRLRPILRENS
mmetsp:Transcript_64249/g.144328  ORF Transcript_64249/g.144328 Transcript_64249/m.144328 type:complete len:232 (+) Transcript_64249:219-914(+)